MKIQFDNNIYEIPRHCLAEIRKRVTIDLKYMRRHNIPINLSRINRLMSNGRLAQQWIEVKAEGLNDHDCIKKVAGRVAFPEKCSREQAEALVEASVKAGEPKTFVQVLRDNAS